MTVLETDLSVRLVTAHGLPCRRLVPAVLRWAADDPWAVQLSGLTRRPWVFGWELLAAATNTCTDAWVGSGDVRIRRATVHDLEIRLSSPDGTGALLVDACDVACFAAAVAARQPAAACRATAVGNGVLRALLDGQRW